MAFRNYRACAWAVAVLLTGCTRWESYRVPTAPAPRLPSYLRVSAPGQDSLVLLEPFVRRDTLFGRLGSDTLGIAVPTIERLERPRLDGLRTFGVVVGGLATWIGLYFVTGSLRD